MTARCLLAAASLLLLVHRGAACAGPRSGRGEWMKIMRERNRFFACFLLLRKDFKGCFIHLGEFCHSHEDCEDMAVKRTCNVEMSRH